MSYFLVDYDKIVEELTEDALIEKANKEIAEDQDYDRTYPRNKPYPDLDLDEAIEYFREKYDILKGEYIYD